MVIVCKLSFSIEISLEIACVDLVFTAQTGIHGDVAIGPILCDNILPWL
jgi:hypothetical protein